MLVATILNPYQGLKRLLKSKLKSPVFRCNYIESLSGIETGLSIHVYRPLRAGCNYIESLSGIETIDYEHPPKTTPRRCNYIESLSGIETFLIYWDSPAQSRLQLY